MGEYVFAGLFLMGAVIGASTLLQIRYGMQDLGNGMMSQVACAVVLALIVAYAVAWLVKSQKFG